MRASDFLSEYRLSHQILGCAEPVLPFLIQEGQVSHTLIVSPPGAGKTTLLRDLIRLISNGVPGLPGRTWEWRMKGRSLAARILAFRRMISRVRTDVSGRMSQRTWHDHAPSLHGASGNRGGRDRKRTGPQEALENVFYSGCKILATVHGSSLEEIKKKPLIRRMMEGRVFERYVLLGFSPRAGSVRKF